MARTDSRLSGTLPFLLYALIVLGHLFLCRLIIAYQAQPPPEQLTAQTVLAAIGHLGSDALAVSIVALLTLAIARGSAAAAATFMALAAGYLMLTGAINVGVMRVYNQPATINLLSYGDFLNLSGLASLTKYMTRADKLALGLAMVLTASFALLPAVRRWRSLGGPAVAWAVVLAALPALVALPLHALLYGDGDSRGRNANAGWRLAMSAIAPPSGRAVQVSDPDLLDPFETYALKSVISPPAIREAHIRNVLVVVLESVGTDYLDSAAAPNLNRLKANAAYFPNTFAPMASSPMSLFSLMAGMYPPVSPRAIPMVEPEFPATTLLESLGSSGRRTAVFSANWGFMDFPRYLKGRAGHLEEIPDDRQCEDCSFASLRHWITQSGQAFAALLWTYRTHYPYGADPSRIAGNPKLAVSRYIAGIRETDRQVGELVAWLEQNGRLDDTLVVIVGDHGEAFLQHGTQSHGNDVYRETVRVPLMLVNKRMFSGVVDPSPVRLIDVAPTLLSLARVPAPETFQGLDLTKPLRPLRVFFAAAWLHLVMGFQEGRMKYNYYYVTDQLQAFDIVRDPNETVDIADRLAPAERAAVVHRIMNWKAAVDSKTEAVRSAPRRR